MLIAVPHCQEGTMRLNIKPKQKSWYVMVYCWSLIRQDVTVVILQLKFKPFCHISVPLKTAVQSDSVTLSSTPCLSVPRGHYPVFPRLGGPLLLNTVFFSHLFPWSYLGRKDGVRGPLADLKSVILVSPLRPSPFLLSCHCAFQNHLNVL